MVGVGEIYVKAKPESTLWHKDGTQDGMVIEDRIPDWKCSGKRWLWRQNRKSVCSSSFIKDFVCPCLNPHPAIDKGFLQVTGFRCSVNLRDWEKARLSHLVEVNKPPLGLYPRLLTALHVLPRCKGIHYSKGKNVSARSHAGQKHLWVRWGAP